MAGILFILSIMAIITFSCYNYKNIIIINKFLLNERMNKYSKIIKFHYKNTKNYKDIPYINKYQKNRSVALKIEHKNIDFNKKICLQVL